MANFQLQLFLSWNDDVTLSEVTKPRYGSVYPWPLNVILSWKKRSQVKKKLTALGWGNKSLEEVRDLFNIYRHSGGGLKCLSDRNVLQLTISLIIGILRSRELLLGLK